MARVRTCDDQVTVVCRSAQSWNFRRLHLVCTGSRNRRHIHPRSSHVDPPAGHRHPRSPDGIASRGPPVRNRLTLTPRARATGSSPALAPARSGRPVGAAPGPRRPLPHGGPRPARARPRGLGARRPSGRLPFLPRWRACGPRGPAVDSRPNTTVVAAQVRRVAAPRRRTNHTTPPATAGSPPPRHRSHRERRREPAPDPGSSAALG